MTHREFFDALDALGPLRIIAVSGPSVLESIGRLERFGFADGHMNAISATCHWHVDLRRFRHLRTRDEVHARSGRRVLFFELGEGADAAPFLLVYVHRGKDEEFDDARLSRFTALHATLAGGAGVTS